MHTKYFSTSNYIPLFFPCLSSPKAPLYNMIGQEEKILAVDWSIPDLMLSGGADNQLKMFNYKSM